VSPAATPAHAARIPTQRRTFPSAEATITVFADQLASGMSEAQYRFAATHYASTQKMIRRDADHLRRYNPAFLILHYRLPLGESDASVRIIDGNQWITDYATVDKQEGWFYHVKGSRELLDQWHWYLMDPTTGWRSYWLARVLEEVADNHDDGIFADSCSVPNFFGGSAWSPALPDYAPTFESWWSRQIDAFLSYAHAHLHGVALIPNAGSWITTRDSTDYSVADGVMIEGFGEWAAHHPFALGDWQLQMNRILSLERKGRIVIAQSYLDDAGDVAVRRFYLATYLLIKGSHTYINYFATGFTPEWYPEFNLPIGVPSAALPGNIGALYDASSGLYSRAYDNGLVIVNPDTAAHSLTLDGTYYLVTPRGGGAVPPDGAISDRYLTYAPATHLTIAPNDAALLIRRPPAGARITR
jgi:hypothetical protein